MCGLKLSEISEPSQFICETEREKDIKKSFALLSSTRVTVYKALTGEHE